jgi:RNA polymerase sigma factor (sigma-70 family)
METDDVLVRRALAGDKSAFGILIDRHRQEVLRLARYVLRGAADAEDCVQEAFLHALLGLRELRAPDRFLAWVLGIVTNVAKSRLRARRETPVADWPGGHAVAGFLWIDAEPSPEARQEARELHDHIWRALAELPAEQREAVQLHYVEELRVWEIAALVGVPSGTVKARLHRARGRLRRLLVAEFDAEAAGPGIHEEGEIAMIEVTVDDVVVQTPKDGDAQWLALLKDYKLGHWRVILLRERDGQRALPIWVGPIEGDVIAMRLAGLSTVRPTPHMLMTRVLELAGITVERVVVTALRNETFYASLRLRIDGRLHEVDARPSDAITVALHTGAPLFVTPEMLELPVVVMAGTALDQLEEYVRRKREAKNEAPEGPAMAWQRFRSLPRAENPWITGP